MAQECQGEEEGEEEGGRIRGGGRGGRTCGPVVPGRRRGRGGRSIKVEGDDEGKEEGGRLRIGGKGEIGEGRLVWTHGALQDASTYVAIMACV